MVRIITDSTSDMDPVRARELGIEIIPLRVFFGEESFLDGIEITKEAFFARLAATEELPTTSQLTPEDFLTVFEKDPADPIVGIFLSSQLSGTFQSAVIAKEMLGDREIYVVDSHMATFGIALLVEAAVALRDEGRSAQEIAQAVEELTRRVRLLAVVDTLTYLKKGGRISAATAAVGGLLGIKPIVGIDSRGTVEAVGKARSMNAGFRWIAERIAKEAPADLRYPVIYGNANAPEAMGACQEVLAPVLETGRPALHASIGAVIGTHVGPGAAGLAYIAAGDQG